MIDFLSQNNNEDKKFRRKIIISSLGLIILRCLRERPTSGYGLIELIHKKFNVLLSPGTIYPILDSLKRSGLVDVFSHNKRRVYRLTNNGIEFYKTFFAKYEENQRRILHYLNST
ncbi:MAG: PadR family transcriptional regulator [Nitrososphaerales archaeon]